MLEENEPRCILGWSAKGGIGPKTWKRACNWTGKREIERQDSCGEERALTMSFVAALRRRLLLIPFFSSGSPSLLP